MVVHLVTFASKEYIHSSILLRHSALQNGVDKVYIYNEDDYIYIDFFHLSPNGNEIVVNKIISEFKDI